MKKFLTWVSLGIILFGGVFAAFTMGKGVAYAGQYLDKNFQFMPFLQKS